MTLAVAAMALAALQAEPPPVETPRPLAWMLDGEIEARVAAAEAEAERFEAAAAAADALRDDVLARRQAASDERARLAESLEALPRGARKDAEARIATLVAQVESLAARGRQAAAEADAHRASAEAQRRFAAQVREEGRLREQEELAALPAGTELPSLPDARLLAARAYHEQRLARIPVQLAALDRQLERARSTPERAAVVARKEGVRAGAAVDGIAMRRIDEELRFREATKRDEALAARQMEAVARARAAERETPVPVATATGPDAVDRMLDRVLEEQDRRAAQAEARARLARRVIRIVATVAGLAVIVGALVLVLRRMA